MALSEGQWAGNSYYDRHFQRQAVKILPGEYFATSGREVIVTVLGSCVAACLQDPGTGIGGMNHFLLPQNSDDDSCLSARYGVNAMELLINEMLAMGAIKTRIRAKVFGGGHVIEAMSSNRVGTRNAEFVEGFLRDEQIPIVASDLCGDYPRKVYFFPDTGQVWVKKIRNLKNDTILVREQSLRERLAQDQVAGSVDLFLES